MCRAYDAEAWLVIGKSISCERFFLFQRGLETAIPSRNGDSRHVIVIQGPPADLVGMERDWLLDAPDKGARLRPSASETHSILLRGGCGVSRPCLGAETQTEG